MPRTTKLNTQTTATANAVQDNVTDVTPNQEFSFLQHMLDSIENQGRIDFKMPTGRRQLCALVATLATIACGMYVGVQVGVYIGIGAMMLTGSAFLSFVLMFMASTLVALASLVLAGKVQKYILLGGIDDTYNTIKAKATSVLAKLNKQAVAA